MSSSIVIPTQSLTAWAQQHLTALLKATTQEAVTDAINRFLAQDARITVNGERVSVANYSQYAAPIALKQDAEVKYDASVEVPKDPKEPAQAGLVGLFFEAETDSKLRILGGPMADKVSSSINLIVEIDNSILPGNPGGGVIQDRRRVKVLNQVYLEKPVPVSFPGGPGPVVGGNSN